MKNKNNNTLVNILCTLIFVVTPALMGFVFLLPDWTGLIILNYGFMWLVSICFLIYTVLMSCLLIWLNIISINSINMNIPFAIVLVVIFVSYPLPIWSRALLTIGSIAFALPINMLTKRIEEKYIKTK